MVRTASTKKAAPKREKSASMKIFIKRIAKDQDPDILVSADALASVDQVLKDKLSALISASASVGENCNRHTVTQKEAKIAVGSMLPSDYAKKLDASAAQRIGKYKATLPKKDAKKDSKKASPKTKSKPVALGTRAGLILSVPKVKSLAKTLLPKYTREKKDKTTEQVQMRINTSALIYLTSVAQDLVARTLELAIAAVKELKKKTITPQAIYAGLVRDENVFVAFSEFVYKNLGQVREEIRGIIEEACSPKKKAGKTKEKKEKKAGKTKEKKEKKSGKTKEKANK